MARNIFGSQNITDTASAIQLFGSEAKPNVLAVTFKARSTNAGNVYLGNDSTAKSSAFELAPGDVADRVYSPIAVSAANFWVWGATSNDKLDYEVLREH